LQFELFDANSDGRLDYYEFRFALRALGFDLPKLETYEYLTKYGIPDPARGPKSDPVWWQFSLTVFQGIAGQLVARKDPTETYKQAFRLFDVDEKGLITVDDLRRVMNEIGRELSDRELAGMISEFDLNAKGGVTEEEFIKIMEKK
jgi:centrin-3